MLDDAKKDFSQDSKISNLPEEGPINRPEPVVNRTASLVDPVDPSDGYLTYKQASDYLKPQYVYLLGRAADTAGLNYWATAISTGQVTPADAISSIAASSEATAYTQLLQSLVKQIYLDELGRAADVGGLNFSVNEMRNGFTQYQVRNEIRNSPEAVAYRASHAGSPSSTIIPVNVQPYWNDILASWNAHAFDTGVYAHRTLQQIVNIISNNLAMAGNGWGPNPYARAYSEQMSNAYTYDSSRMYTNTDDRGVDPLGLSVETGDTVSSGNQRFTTVRTALGTSLNIDLSGTSDWSSMLAKLAPLAGDVDRVSINQYLVKSGVPYQVTPDGTVANVQIIIGHLPAPDAGTVVYIPRPAAPNLSSMIKAPVGVVPLTTSIVAYGLDSKKTAGLKVGDSGKGKVADALTRVKGLQVPAAYNPADPHSYVILVFQDGTQNSANQNITTNPRELSTLVPVSPNISSIYVSGIGADYDLAFLNSALALGSSAQLLEAQTGIATSVTKIVTSDASANISFVLVGFSRGAADTRILENLLTNNGVPNLNTRVDTPYGDGTVRTTYDNAIAPGQVKIGGALLYDTVSTGLTNMLNLKTPPSVGYTLSLTAQNEYRDLFPLTSAINADGSNIGHVMEISIPGAHTDIGGGSYDMNGIGAATLQMGVEYLKKLGIPMNAVPANRLPDPSQYVIHDSRWVHDVPFYNLVNNPAVTRTVNKF